jgi:hypothetical protein
MTRRHRLILLLVLSAPPLAWLATGLPVRWGTLASAEVAPDSSPGAGYRTERVRLRSSAGRELNCVLRTPEVVEPGRSYPAVLVAGGRRTGRNAARYLDSAVQAVAISCDYPWRDPARLSWPRFIVRLPRTRAELLATPGALAVAASYLATRSEADTGPFLAIGASLGVAPVAAWAARDARPQAVALLYGGANLGAILEANLGTRVSSGLLRRLAARTLGAALRPLEPAHNVGRIAPRPLLVVAAADDQWIPMASAQLLYDAAREPKRLVWLRGEHVATRDEVVLRILTDSIVAWAGSFMELGATSSPGPLRP